MNQQLDWKFYIDFYPDLPHNNIKTEHSARTHYFKFGRHEGRIPNVNVLAKKLREIQDDIEQDEKKLIDTIDNPIQNRHHFTILIRTNKRQNSFQQCLRSVFSQEYDNYKVLVSYDTDDTFDYVQPFLSYGIEAFDMRNHVNMDVECGFNLYCNELMSHVTDGFLLFLDDDDQFTHTRVLQQINACLQHSNNQNQIVVWKFARPDKVIVPKHLPALTFGEIDTTCVCFHSSHRNRARWKAQRGGDFAFYTDLFKSFPFHFTMLDSILTQTQYTNKVCGFGLSQEYTCEK